MATASPPVSSIGEWGRRLTDRKDKKAAWVVACCLLVAEAALGLAIIRYVPCEWPISCTMGLVNAIILP